MHWVCVADDTNADAILEIVYLRMAPKVMLNLFCCLQWSPVLVCTNKETGVCTEKRKFYHQCMSYF